MYSCTEIKNLLMFGGISEPICELSRRFPGCNVVAMDDFKMETLSKQFGFLKS